MAEEHGFQASEGHRLCSNNCGFFGSLATSNLCSKCHRDSRMKEEQGALAKAAFDANSTAKAAPPAPASFRVAVPEVESETAAADPVVSVSVSAVAQPNRCLSCRKRVGLTAFKCRCGAVYCGSHRYPEQHGCAFDYKAAGKEAIAKANPVVKAGKLNKI